MCLWSQGHFVEFAGPGRRDWCTWGYWCTRLAQVRTLALRRQGLTGANMEDTSLTNSNAASVNLTDANLTNTDLAGANMTDSDLSATTNASSANLTGVIWNNATCPDGTRNSQDLWMRNLSNYAATSFSSASDRSAITPLSNTTPARTRATSSGALTARHLV